MKTGSLALPLILAFLALPGALRATTPVSGSLKDLGTNAVTTGAFVRFTLRGCGGNQPTVPGVAVLAGPGMPYFNDFAVDGSGNVSGTLYSTRDAAGTGNGEILCGTSYTAAWYGMTVWVGGKGGPEMAVHAKNGVTLDPGTVTPLTTNPVATAPTGDSTYARLDGGNQPFSGSITAPNVTATTLVKGSQVQSTIATGTPPLVVSSTTQVASLNASQLGGLSAPASAIVGISDSQALTNKTINLASNTVTGVLPPVASVDITGRTTAITTTTLYAVPVGRAGIYRLFFDQITTTNGTSGTISPTFSWNNGTSAQSWNGAAVGVAIAGSETQNAIGSSSSASPVVFYSAASQNISYSTTFNTVVGSPAYSLRIRLEGPF